jgi:hypothetical protein
MTRSDTKHNGIFAGNKNYIYAANNNVIIGGSNNTIMAPNENDSVLLGGKGLILTNSHNSPQVIMGKYNSEGGSFDRILTFGDGLNNSVRSNKFSIDTLGNVRAEGMFIPTTTADFAEFFESHNGQTIPMGTSVVVDPDSGKIRPASEKTDLVPIGVISGTAGLLGNSADVEWTDKYLKDDFGQVIWEEVEGRRMKKINPDYDPNKVYKARRERDEWNIVGLLGQIHILKDQPVAPGWIKLKNMVDKPCDLWLVK